MLESLVSVLPADWFSLSGWPRFQKTQCHFYLQFPPFVFFCLLVCLFSFCISDPSIHLIMSYCRNSHMAPSFVFAR